MAGSTGLEPATSGLTERDALGGTASPKWCESLTSLGQQWEITGTALLDLVGRNWRGLEGRGHGRRQSTGDPTPRVAPPRNDPENLRCDQGRTLWSVTPPLFWGGRQRRSSETSKALDDALCGQPPALTSVHSFSTYTQLSTGPESHGVTRSRGLRARKTTVYSPAASTNAKNTPFDGVTSASWCVHKASDAGKRSIDILDRGILS